MLVQKRFERSAGHFVDKNWFCPIELTKCYFYLDTNQILVQRLPLIMIIDNVII